MHIIYLCKYISVLKIIFTFLFSYGFGFGVLGPFEYRFIINLQSNGPGVALKILKIYINI